MAAALFGSGLSDDELLQVAYNLRDERDLAASLAQSVIATVSPAKSKSKPPAESPRVRSSLSADAREQLATWASDALRKRRISKRELEEVLLLIMPKIKAYTTSSGSSDTEFLIQLFAAEATEDQLRDFYEWLSARTPLGDDYLREMMKRS